MRSQHHRRLLVHLIHITEWIVLSQILWSHVLWVIHLRHAEVLVLHWRHWHHVSKIWHVLLHVLKLVGHILHSVTEVVVWYLTEVEVSKLVDVVRVYLVYLADVTRDLAEARWHHELLGALVLGACAALIWLEESVLAFFVIWALSLILTCIWLVVYACGIVDQVLQSLRVLVVDVWHSPLGCCGRGVYLLRQVDLLGVGISRCLAFLFLPLMLTWWDKTHMLALRWAKISKLVRYIDILSWIIHWQALGLLVQP